MGIRSIKKLRITCDTCKKLIATGKSSTDFISKAEEEQRYTEIFCTDCVKLSVEEIEKEKELSNSMMGKE